MTDEIQVAPPQNGGQDLPTAFRVRTVERKYVDRDSGEILRLEHEEEVIPRRRPAEEKSDDPFTLMYPAALVHLAPTQKWAALMCLLVMWPIDQSEFRYSTNTIANELGVRPSYVSALLKELEEDGVIERTSGRKVKINPNLFWRGKPKERRRALWNRERAHA